MTQPQIGLKLIRVKICFIVLLNALLPGSVRAQNQPKPAPSPFASAPQTTQAQLENFPRQLLDELAAIKAAALTDDYAYHQVAHLTENIGPRPSGSLQAKAAVDYVA